MRGSVNGTPENVLLKGPQGCGKTETAIQFAAWAGLPVLKVNCALIREPRDWFGYKTVENTSVMWVRSEFAKLIERGGAVILLDEISRATPPVLNSLLPLLDGTGFTFLEEVKQVVKRGKDLYFFATANIGNEFTGTYGKLDKALDDRFAIRIEANYLKASDEIKLLKSRTGLSAEDATKLVKLANHVRNDSSSVFGGQFPTTISTRNLLDAAVLYKSIGIQSFDYTIVPLFSSKGGTNSHQAAVRQIIQSYFG
jgi:MoxR-like ATPase